MLRATRLPCKHFRMRDRSQHVVPDESLVESVILARGVSEHTLIEWRALVPQTGHLPALCCSAALNAFTSATMSVPVPSLVNTSASTLSGAV